MQFDDLAYFSRFTANHQVALPVVFHDPRPPQPPHDHNDGLAPFQSLVVLPFEPLAPPVFRRNLLWDSEVRSAGVGWFRHSSGRILLCLQPAVATVAMWAQQL